MIIELFVIMSIGQLLHEVPVNDRAIFRLYEKSKKKLVSAEACVTFNQTCLNEKLLPDLM